MDFDPASDQEPAPRQARILVVGREAKTRTFLADILARGGYAVETARDEDEALAHLAAQPPDVLVTEPELGGHGESFLASVHAERPTVVPIALVGHGTMGQAIEHMRAGAFDVLAKPCRAGEVLAMVEKAVGHHRALAANAELRRRLEVQDKLAMIGRLAAGVAHELNNPLDAALRCVRLLEERVAKDAEAVEYLDLARAGLLRMADIVQGLLTFSRHAQLERALEPLVRVVDGAMQAVSLALGPAAPEFVPRLSARAADHLVPRGLHQVLVNLLRNAADAAGPDEPVDVRASFEDGELLVEVVDRGPGIPPDARARVFEPFFTTKQPGRGTGLGLPISARTVERYGGRLALDCPPEGGTVARIHLPPDPTAPDGAPAPKEGATA